MASAAITSTTLANWNPTLWAGKTLGFRKAALHLAKLVSTEFTSGLTYGVTLRIANKTAMTEAQKSEGISNTVSYEAITEGKTDLTINQHWYTAMLIEEFEAHLSKYDIRSEYQESMMYPLAKRVDTFLADFVDGATNNVGALAVPNGDAEYRRALQYLEDNTVPPPYYWYLSPAEKNTAMGLDRFSSADFLGMEKLPVRSGLFGSLYGHAAYVSTQVEGSNPAGHDNAFFARQFVEFHMRKTPRIRVVWENQYQGETVVATEIFGGTELRDADCCWVKGM